jgi:hypothetical protein
MAFALGKEAGIMKVSLCAIFTTLIISSSMAITRTGHHASSSDRAPSGAMTAEERAALVDQFTKTKQAFIDSIRGLSEAQWRFKPNPFKWSVAECAEHIILSEDFLFGVSQQMLKSPAQDRATVTGQPPDEALLMRAADRSQKVFNPDALAPKGRFKTPDEAIAEFSARRDRHIEYARTTTDELRAHFSPGPAGTKLDAYQFLLLTASHSARHTAQIKEVEADPKYPAAR